MKTMSVKFNDDVISEIKKISSLFDISYSDFIRNAVKKEIEEKQKNFIYRMSNVPYVSEEEEKEILEELDKLTEDDLKIAKIDILKI